MNRSEVMSILSAKYDELYDKVSQIMETYDPCRIEDGECHRGRQNPNKNFCCSFPPGVCKHLTSEGCSVKSLPCRIWLCNYIEQDIETRVRIDMHDIYADPFFRLLSKVFRGSKEENLKCVEENHCERARELIRSVRPDLLGRRDCGGSTVCGFNIKKVILTLVDNFQTK